MTNYRRKRRPMKVAQRDFKINHELEGSEFRIIDEEGKMLGVFSRTEAFDKAVNEEMDLIEVNPKANPPVVKLMPYTKFKYQLSKAGNDKVKAPKDAKVLRLSVRVSDNDLKVAADKAVKFLEKGLKVKLQVQMRGREKAYPDIAKGIMEKLISSIKIEYTYESTPELTGDSYHASLNPKKK